MTSYMIVIVLISYLQKKNPNGPIGGLRCMNRCRLGIKNRGSGAKGLRYIGLNRLKIMIFE